MSIRLTRESSISTFSMLSAPLVLPGKLMIAPPQEFPPELQSLISPSRSVTLVSSARSKHASDASLISKSVIVRTVPCPDPCLNAVPTFLNETWSIVKFPTLALLEGAEPCLLPAAIAASLVLAKFT